MSFVGAFQWLLGAFVVAFSGVEGVLLCFTVSLLGGVSNGFRCMWDSYCGALVIGLFGGVIFKKTFPLIHIMLISAKKGWS